MIDIDGKLAISESEVEESFIRASGPGGQNVNKVSTAVQIRFDVRNSPSLPESVKRRLERIAGSRMTGDGVLIITAQRHRTQPRNRADAVERLVAMIREAAIPPVPRRPTRPSLGSKKRRVESKVKRGAVKKTRGKQDWD